eukprot:1216091-Pyramimonas_sp.AAC.3
MRRHRCSACLGRLAWFTTFIKRITAQTRAAALAAALVPVAHVLPVLACAAHCVLISLLAAALLLAWRRTVI